MTESEQQERINTACYLVRSINLDAFSCYSKVWLMLSAMMLNSDVLKAQMSPN